MRHAHSLCDRSLEAEPYWHDDAAAARGYIEGVPESIEWHWNLAYDLDKQGDSTDAEQELRTALRLEPDTTGSVFAPHSYELHHYLGELLARRGDIQGAELEIGKSLNGPPDEGEVHPPRPPVHTTMMPSICTIRAFATQRRGAPPKPSRKSPRA